MAAGTNGTGGTAFPPDAGMSLTWKDALATAVAGVNIAIHITFTQGTDRTRNARCPVAVVRAKE